LHLGTSGRCAGAFFVLEGAHLSLFNGKGADSYKKPNITISLADRASVAEAAVEVGISRLSIDGQFEGWSPAAFYIFEESPIAN
jgi:hypothetical protein